MISEGVDIKRLRVLVYLPNARTELAFRQSIGRVVRTMGDNDFSRAYVIMPILHTLEKYAQRVEREMSPQANKIPPKSSSKTCPICDNACGISDKECLSCGHEFPEKREQFISCNSCKSLNLISNQNCHTCGSSLHTEFTIELREAYRDGAITRGMKLTEADIKASEAISPSLDKDVLSSGSDVLISMWSSLPQEAKASFLNIVNQSSNKME